MSPPLAGFCGPTYVSQSRIASPERSVNWYPELIEVPKAEFPVVLYPTPGVVSFGTMTQSACRGLFEEQDRVWAAGGARLQEFTGAGGAATDRGALVVDSNPATFCSSGDFGGQVFITSGDLGYILTLSTNVLTQPVNDVTMGGYVDGYFVALDATTATLRISALADGATWTQTAQRSAGADRWVSLFVNHREIWLFGSKTSEVWYNAGTSPFPFLLYPGSFMEVGCAAGFSVASMDNSLVWLGRDKNGRCMVWRAAGYRPQRISTHAIEYALQGYTTVSDAIGWAYQDQGHSFYVLTFPTENATWVYDAATQLWHERLYWNTTTAQYQAYRPMFHCFAFNRHLVGDRDDFTIYEMAIDQYADVGGAAIRRLRRGPIYEKDGHWLNWKDVEFVVEPGIGLSGSGQGSDPNVQFRYSSNGGFTWSNTRQTTAGAMGNYDTRVLFRSMGRGRRFVPELVMTDPVAWRIVGARGTFEVGAR